VVAELVAAYPEEHIKGQIEAVDWLQAKRPGKVKEVGAYLANAIRADYAAPTGLAKGREKQARRAGEEAEARAAATEKAREREERARIDAYWAGLSPDQRRQLEADALEQADPEVRASCETGPLPVRRMTLVAVHEAYIRALLNLPGVDPTVGA
jgi:hypothetical protein